MTPDEETALLRLVEQIAKSTAQQATDVRELKAALLEEISHLRAVREVIERQHRREPL